MGSGCGKMPHQPFVPNDNVTGQETSVVEVFHALMLSDEEIQKMFDLFRMVKGGAKNGLIMASDFFAILQLTNRRYDNAIFCMFDNSGESLINFSEFVCGLWNFLSLSPHELARFTLQVYCWDDLLERDYHKVVYKLLKLIYGETSLTKNDAQDVLQGMSNMSANVVTENDVVEWIYSYQALVDPLLEIQSAYHEQILGTDFWVPILRNRSLNIRMNSGGFVFDQFGILPENYHHNKVITVAKLKVKRVIGKSLFLQHKRIQSFGSAVKVTMAKADVEAVEEKASPNFKIPKHKDFMKRAVASIATASATEAADDGNFALNSKTTAKMTVDRDDANAISIFDDDTGLLQ